MVDFKELHKFTRAQFEEAKAMGSRKAAYLKGISDAYYFAKGAYNGDMEYTIEEAVSDYNAHKETANKGIRAEYHTGYCDATKFYLSTLGVEVA